MHLFESHGCREKGRDGREIETERERDLHASSGPHSPLLEGANRSNEIQLDFPQGWQESKYLSY